MGLEQSLLLQVRCYGLVTSVLAVSGLLPWQVSQKGLAERAWNLRRGETHAFVHGDFINLMKSLNEDALLFLVPASNHFMF